MLQICYLQKSIFSSSVCCSLSFSPSLPLFLILVQFGVLSSPGFYRLVVTICVFSVVSFPLSLYFSGFSFFHLFTLSLDFSALLGMIKLLERRFEWLSFNNDFLYPLITIWFKRTLNTSFNMFKLPTWVGKYNLFINAFKVRGILNSL